MLNVWGISNIRNRRPDLYEWLLYILMVLMLCIQLVVEIKFVHNVCFSESDWLNLMCLQISKMSGMSKYTLGKYCSLLHLHVFIY